MARFAYTLISYEVRVLRRSGINIVKIYANCYQIINYVRGTNRQIETRSKTVDTTLLSPPRVTRCFIFIRSFLSLSPGENNIFHRTAYLFSPPTHFCLARVFSPFLSLSHTLHAIFNSHFHNIIIIMLCSLSRLFDRFKIGNRRMHSRLA